MERGNLSAVTEFIFTGFPQLQDGGLLYFFPLLFVYTFIVIGNLMVFFAVQLDTHPHNPMYNFISIFPFLGIRYMTATIPKMFSNLICEKKTISITGCLLQMYFLHSLGNPEGILSTTMAIDRSVAICDPLHCQMIMTPRLCARFSAGSCILGLLILLPEIVMISTPPLCGPDQICQIFCDSVLVLSLACTDTSTTLVGDVIHAVAITATILIIALFSIRMVTVVLRIPSAEARQKAFSTCAGHLAVSLIFFGHVSLMYSRFNATYLPVLDTTTALMFTILAPFFNPVTYSLRNKDMKNAIRTLFTFGKRSTRWRLILSHKSPPPVLLFSVTD
ncbi:olfactory receptor 6K3-like [Panthera uncia]|uniref:olfactory receptor 6K3-like n=1 Tax=Panthera uncia TaxID=29064 RepID=UPI0020FF7CE9|nr:olfactory receptor 6K3-like [Panthera uncia]